MAGLIRLPRPRLWPYAGRMSRPQGRDTYRHGALREEALAAALELARQGEAAITMRAVAERVGVAHRALYNHFADRAALIDAAAAQVFEQLAAVAEGAATRDDFIARYVGFALANPGLYALMANRPHGEMNDKPALKAAVHPFMREAARLFGDPARSSEENRRAVMRVVLLLRGGLSMYGAGILDVAGEAGLVSELQAMVRGL